MIFGAEFPLPRRGWGWARPAWPQAEGHVGIQATEGRNETTARGRPGYAMAISGIRKMAFSFDEGRRIGGTGSIETAGADGPDFVDIPLLLPPRGDFPWLAYSAGPEEITVEAVGLPPLDIKVFRKEQHTAELPHFEGFPPEVGFSRFWRGDIHLVIGEFQVRDHVHVQARFVPVRHAPADVGWFVCEVEGERVAEGVGCDVTFEAEPGRRYYLTAVTRNHPAYEQCPLCRRSRFE